jgi:hypothetical protein
MKISQKVFRLKQDVQLTKNIKLSKGQEIEVVRDVVYMGGYPVRPGEQKLFLDWILNNQNLLINDTRRF